MWGSKKERTNALFLQLNVAKLLYQNGADPQLQFEVLYFSFYKLSQHNAMQHIATHTQPTTNHKGKCAVDWAEAQEQFAVMRYLVQIAKSKRA